jgi:two-component system chemotaxis response regulator CheY
MAKTVLIVDDTKLWITLVKTALMRLKYETIEAAGGDEALKKAMGKEIDLVITDYNMPGMNGVEFVKTLKGLSNFKGVPVIMLTTEEKSSIKLEGKNAGVDHWITKPFSADDLVELVKKVVGE